MIYNRGVPPGIRKTITTCILLCYKLPYRLSRVGLAFDAFLPRLNVSSIIPPLVRDKELNSLARDRLVLLTGLVNAHY